MNGRLSGRIAIVGLACEYPDASSPGRLWENVLAQRRAFRRMPDQRTPLADYWSADPSAPDRFYADMAAVIEGYEFDRVGFKIAGSTFRATDLTHWLALDVASRALADAGFPGGAGLPAQATGVIVGNTLTGEFSRANGMRLRWPYVARTVAAELAGEDWDGDRIGEFLAALEGRYKAPFPPIDEDTLAGGLSNTIAGRICNHFDLKGGGYTVDGACSSSLLSVVTACTGLTGHDLDVAIVGGVDLSIDPFELVGFAKVGAITARQMRVYDREDSGFWPGEGCGMAILMREEDAAARNLPVYALISGWGVSSDGRGGITRPEVDGYRLAMRRAYARAGYGPDTVSYFEGHSTGTRAGDDVELRAILAERGDAEPAMIGSIKALIGHTKAACGIAGLIKATLAVRDRVIPPTAGCVDPHLLFEREDATLRPSAGEPWPAGRPARAAVTSMGFGGINTHVVVEGADPEAARRDAEGDGDRAAALLQSAQDQELLLFDADDPAALTARLTRVGAAVPQLSIAELGDLAATLHDEYEGRALRAAVVATGPANAATAIRRLLMALHDGEERLTGAAGAFLGRVTGTARVGLLFPGQGVRHGVGHGSGGDGALAHRFPEVAEVYGDAWPDGAGDPTATEVAQPMIVAASLAGLRVLRALDIDAAVAVGHSVGELTALHWAGAFDEATALRIAVARGRVMADLGHAGGAMAGVAATAERVEELLTGEPVVVAGLNSPQQTVISGPAEAVERVGARATGAGLTWSRLAVSHAFHSPLVALAGPALADRLAGEPIRPLRRRVVSTVTGGDLTAGTDLVALLTDQVTLPVRFTDAVARAAADVGLFIEVGPGRVLTGLATEICGIQVVPLSTDSPSLGPLLRAVAAAVVTGVPVRTDAIFKGRFSRPLPLDAPLSFFTNPCESAPARRKVSPEPMVPNDSDLSDEVTPAAGREPAGDADLAARTGPAGLDGSAGQGGPADHADLTGRRGPGGQGGPVGRTGPGGPADLAGPHGPGGPADLTGRAEPASPAGPGQAGQDTRATIDLVRELAAARAELPLDMLSSDTRPLDDLHLSSITVGQIMNEAAARLGLTALAPSTTFATATLAELAQSLDDLTDTAALGDGARPRRAEGAGPWVRPFAVELVKAPRPARVPAADGAWTVLAPKGHRLAAPLRQALEAARIGAGVLVCVPPDCAGADVGLLLDGARRALAADPGRCVFVQCGRGATALAKTLHLEAPHVTTCVVTLPGDIDLADTRLADWVVAEAAATTSFTEVVLDETGDRYVPVLRPFTTTSDHGRRWLLDDTDVILVTGGGKGITAECARAVALEGGAALAILGRADPAQDAELSGNLDRLTASGVRHRYVRADVTSPEQVAAAVATVRAALGEVTAVLHGAGHNEPASLATLDEAAFRRTLAPKIDGLAAVLDAVDPARLRLLVSFGSIIGRAGLRGQADYATANEWLTDRTLAFGRAHPGCRCLAMEWSVWSGVGMGERLGVIESLIRDGITPISPDAGIAMLRRLIADPRTPDVTVVTGRLDDLDTVSMETAELPLLRFVDKPLVHYPGIELVTEATLTEHDDPYLTDHLFEGDLLFPAVLGLEAMTQVATAVAPQETPSHRHTAPRWENLEFLRPIVVPRGGTTTIRVAALVHETGLIDVVIRSSETAFAAEHFRGTYRTSPTEPTLDRAPGRTGERDDPDAAGVGDPPPVPLDPGDLYGAMLFQGPRFQRLTGYRRLTATSCTAEISGAATTTWFGATLPDRLVIGDPGPRDAFMHAIQACVPDAVLLPVGVERITPAARPWPSRLLLSATERSSDGDVYVYRVAVHDDTGEVVEEWEGLRLRAVRRSTGAGPWQAPLLGPYLQRCLSELLPAAPSGVAVAPEPPSHHDPSPTTANVSSVPVDPDGPSGHDARPTAATATSVPVDPDRSGRRNAAAAAASRAMGRAVTLRHRTDGRPETTGSISISHGPGVVFAVADESAIRIGCDVEGVLDRPEAWPELLGADRIELARFVAADLAEAETVAATRVWSAVECLVKSGEPATAPLAVTGEENRRPGWLTFASGDARVATFVTAVAGVAGPVVFAVLAGTARPDEAEEDR